MVQTAQIFDIKNSDDFAFMALKIFHYQAANNLVYKRFLAGLRINPELINEVSSIPFLPIEFFKRENLAINNNPATEAKLFISSGTTGTDRSHHYISDISLYEKSFLKGFSAFYGNIKEYCLLALLPSYQENKSSSLIYMIDRLMAMTECSYGGYFINDFEDLARRLDMLKQKNKKTILIGVSHALLDFAEALKDPLKTEDSLTVMETGGMKGRRKELIREELHNKLCAVLGVPKIHSEYGMTELLSQAYSAGHGIFNAPPWMKILIRDPNDPFTLLACEQTGGINIIDLANINSCSFIATQDLGKLYSDGSFEVLGRFDYSDIRGCSLLV